MNKNMMLIAAGRTDKAVRNYSEKINSLSWMNQVNEEDIYAEIVTPEFGNFMFSLGLDSITPFGNEAA